MNALQQFEIEELEGVELTEETKDRFKINDLDQLNWAFRKYNALLEEKKKKEQLAAAEIERITMWINAEKKPIEDSLLFFEFLIKEYHQEQLEADPKAKTISTPYGKSKSRVVKEAPKQVNKDFVLDYVKSNNLTDFIKEEVKWAELKKTLKVADVGGKKIVLNEDGQVVPGVEVAKANTSFKVEV
ncbi:hypothetical protein AB685_29455 [Bacillus sp. LL01]|uniref:host-nuclease inhibitor Gam family protein n=1 Tax=Bacillus sp. LL01 TaxID=1665556 RepID=UPI00064D69A9|nr:host-nuclease inhibitor Gam family protein [Bacillus sp. LL01]KMJ55022.1 hypothetical protein AB685_29455 [Bacillus sp. LL01]